jgi:hypothetical protein
MNSQLPKLTRSNKIRYSLLTILLLLTIISSIIFISCIGFVSVFIELLMLFITILLISLSIVFITNDYKYYMNSLFDYILIKIFEK